MTGIVPGTKITTALELVDNISGNLSKITKSVAEFTASFNKAEGLLIGDLLNELGTYVDGNVILRSEYIYCI